MIDFGEFRPKDSQRTVLLENRSNAFDVNITRHEVSADLAGYSPFIVNRETPVVLPPLEDTTLGVAFDPTGHAGCFRENLVVYTIPDEAKCDVVVRGHYILPPMRLGEAPRAGALQSVSLKIGEQYDAAPLDGAGRLVRNCADTTWSASRPDIVDVGGGTITALNVGQATVVARVRDDERAPLLGAEAAINVTVCTGPVGVACPETLFSTTWDLVSFRQVPVGGFCGAGCWNPDPSYPSGLYVSRGTLTITAGVAAYADEMGVTRWKISDARMVFAVNMSDTAGGTGAPMFTGSYGYDYVGYAPAAFVAGFAPTPGDASCPICCCCPAGERMYQGSWCAAMPAGHMYGSYRSPRYAGAVMGSDGLLYTSLGGESIWRRR